MLDSPQSSRILLIGANGRLGRAIQAHFSNRYEVITLTRAELDLEDLDAIVPTLNQLEFDEVLLTSAMTNVDICEGQQELAFQINARAPRVIAKVCNERGVRMTYFSTDFVFDGSKDGLYDEQDDAYPLSIYASSKFKGEEFVMTESAANLVVRLSWVYGSGMPAFPEWIAGMAEKESTLSLPVDKKGCPSYSSDLAALLEPLLFASKGQEPASGIYHLCNSEVCTWQEWGQMCLDLIVCNKGRDLKTKSIGGNLLSDIAAFKAIRPENSAMSTARYTRYTGIVPRSWRDALEEYLQPESTLTPVHTI